MKRKLEGDIKKICFKIRKFFCKKTYLRKQDFAAREITGSNTWEPLPWVAKYFSSVSNVMNCGLGDKGYILQGEEFLLSPPTNLQSNEIWKKIRLQVISQNTNLRMKTPNNDQIETASLFTTIGWS